MEKKSIRIVYSRPIDQFTTTYYYELYNKLHRKATLVEGLIDEIMRDITTGCHNYFITLLTLEEVERELNHAIEIVKSVGFDTALVKANVCENLIIAEECRMVLLETLQKKRREAAKIYIAMGVAKEKFDDTEKQLQGASTKAKVMEVIEIVEL